MALKRIRLIYRDIRPGNMLLDVDRNLKLSDFDRGMKIGEDIVVLTELYWRLLDAENDGDVSTYGTAGARTEPFAIGPVYYTLLRGHEPYETESWDRDHFVTLGEKFQNKEFPSLTNSAADAIIRKCWHGKYQLVGELMAESDDAGQDEPVGEDPEWRETRQIECKKFIQSGLVDTLNSY
jgi:serine/threonine protein kinase